MTQRLENNQGFALVGALFLLVVLGGLGAMMVNLSATQHSTVSMAIQGSRAYQASRAGLEWGTARALAGNCVGNSSFMIVGFTVEVTCNREVVSESAVNYNVYTLRSTASSGNYGEPNFVSRRTEVRVADAS